jgi:hypothetical protein
MAICNLQSCNLTNVALYDTPSTGFSEKKETSLPDRGALAITHSFLDPRVLTDGAGHVPAILPAVLALDLDK